MLYITVVSVVFNGEMWQYTNNVLQCEARDITCTVCLVACKVNYSVTRLKEKPQVDNWPSETLGCLKILPSGAFFVLQGERNIANACF